MANIRYQSTFKNIDNIEYRISIVDTSYSGSVISNFEVSADLFTLDYDSGEDNYNPLVSSQLTINFQLFNNPQRNDTTLFSFLKSMVQQNTQLYYIKIEEDLGSGFFDYWIGNIVQNQSSYANAPIESGIEFQVIANDFGFLENKPFEQLSEFTPTAINLTTDIITYAAHGFVDGQVVKFLNVGTLGNVKVATNYFVYIVGANEFQICSSYENATADTPIVINLTGSTTTLPTMAYTDFGNYTLNGCLQLVNNFQGFGTDKFDFWNNINWFENSLTGIPNLNVLREIDTLLYNFYDFSDATNNINFIDIFKNIASLFGARLIQSNGKYYLIQLQNYTASTSTFRNASTSATINTRKAVNNTVGVSALKLLAGSIYSWVRPYSKIVDKQPNNKIITTYSGTISNLNFFARKTLNNIYGGFGNRVRVDTKSILETENAFYSPNFVTVTDFSNKNHYFECTYITGGITYYLGKTSGVLTWGTTFNFFYINFDISADDRGEWNSSFVTPELPNAGVVGVFNYKSVANLESASLGVPDRTLSNMNATITFLPRGFEGEEIFYNASLSPQPFDAISKELPELLLWDTYVTTGKGTMTISATGLATNSWQIGSASTNQYPIHELIVRNALALNYRAKQLIEGTIRGNYYPHELLTYDSIQWAIKRATYTAGSNQWNGEWFELTYNDSDIATAQNTANNGDNQNGQSSIVKFSNTGDIYDYIKQTDSNLKSLARAVNEVGNGLNSEIATRGNNDNNIYKYIDFLLTVVPFVARTASTYYKDDVITDLAVDSITKDVKPNDVLIIVNLVTGLTYKVTAAANANIGETSIPIDSFTFTSDMIDTCLVLFKMQRDADHHLEIVH